MKRTDWIDYDGRRNKSVHDIMLKDGTIIYMVYPNANTWTPMANYSKNPPYRKYDDSEVARIREYDDEEGGHKGFAFLMKYHAWKSRLDKCAMKKELKSKDYIEIASDMGSDFLHAVIGYHDNMFSNFVRALGYKRDRANDLLSYPEDLKIKDIVKIAHKFGFSVEIKVKNLKEK